MHKAHDVIIVGGGSAGSVLAARLSEDATRRVLLLEAGPNFAPHDFPDLLRRADRIADPAHLWGVKTVAGVDVPTARVIGGGSTVNAAAAMRATRSDFHRWAAHGLTGWSWEEALAAYKALERSDHAEDAWHGRHGPLAIHQRRPEENTPSLRAFVAASEACGFAYLPDLDASEDEGVGEFPMNVEGDTRLSTGMVYLTDAVRARRNLTIRSGITVDTVMFDGQRAIGVRLAGGEVIAAGQVVLSAGTFGSAAILLRSGIGPAEHLAAFDIPVVRGLPVGARLKDHPVLWNVHALKPGYLDMTPPLGAMVWARSDQAEADERDIHISATHIFDPANSPTGGAIVLTAALVAPRSTGTVRLASRDPHAQPIVALDYFAQPIDLDRLTWAVQLARRIADTEPLAGMIERELAPGPDVADEVALRRHIAAHVATYAHPTSTAPMGVESDPFAVVSSRGEVFGIEGLRVVDASIMPATISVATNITTIMIAERIAAWF